MQLYGREERAFPHGCGDAADPSPPLEKTSREKRFLVAPAQRQFRRSRPHRPGRTRPTPTHRSCWFSHPFSALRKLQQQNKLRVVWRADLYLPLLGWPNQGGTGRYSGFDRWTEKKGQEITDLLYPSAAIIQRKPASSCAGFFASQALEGLSYVR
jgi:hypothetical protein